MSDEPQDESLAPESPADEPTVPEPVVSPNEAPTVPPQACPICQKPLTAGFCPRDGFCQR